MLLRSLSVEYAQWRVCHVNFAVLSSASEAFGRSGFGRFVDIFAGRNGCICKRLVVYGGFIRADAPCRNRYDVEKSCAAGKASECKGNAEKTGARRWAERTDVCGRLCRGGIGFPVFLVEFARGCDGGCGGGVFGGVSLLCGGFAGECVPEWVVITASVLFLTAYVLYAEVMRENAYLSRTIEVQDNQRVIDTGLYGVVRHPMYSVTLLLFLSMPLMLGSLYAFFVFLVYPVLITIRIKYEEELLERELDGYRMYKQRVKYRLIPFVW